jgi:hypothetical protein
VGGHAAAHGKNTLRNRHPHNVPRESFQADENHFFAFFRIDARLLSGENDSAASRARGCREAGADNGRGRKRFRVKLRMQQRVELFGSTRNTAYSSVKTPSSTNPPQFSTRRRGTIAVSGLVHVEFAVFNGELHVLHIFIMCLEALGDGDELLYTEAYPL